MPRVKSPTSQRKNGWWLLSFSIIIGSVLFVILSARSSAPQTSSQAALPTPIPSPTPEFRQHTWISPDGSATLIMDKQETAANQVEYTVSVERGDQRQLVFSQTLSADDTYLIPFNSWSPDNKYFFLSHDAAGRHEIMVFSAIGKAFANSADRVAVRALFEAKYPTMTFKEVTGWASPIFLIVNAYTQDASPKKISYWFDVTRLTFTQLWGDF